jgi:DNA-binding NtrC family response regulator
VQERRSTLAEAGISTSLVRDRTPVRTLIARVVAGKSTGASTLLSTRPITVGAEHDADLVVDDPKVSRRHCSLEAVPGGVAVRDLGSTNGTFVDAARIKEATFPLGSIVRIGDTALDISAGTSPAVSPSARDRFGGLAGDSLSMREVFTVLELAAPTDATVLIQGESGTGKELAARALHDHSPRAEKPFVIVDCSAAAEDLVESQLFGHRKGAFTGAADDRKGAFVEADGGTLFLDEIGELSLHSQARLLRALEARTVQPLGADRSLHVDVRVVAATHRDLASMVEAKTFRFDLFHRLAVVHLMIPPLRSRREDLPKLIRYFYEGRGLEPGPIDGENLRLLEARSWPGNVRELRNALERALVLSGPARTRFSELLLVFGHQSTWPFDVVDTTLPFKEAKQRWVESFERRYLLGLYHKSGGNISRAAEAAGLTRHHFRELLDRYGLRDLT